MDHCLASGYSTATGTSPSSAPGKSRKKVILRRVENDSVEPFPIEGLFAVSAAFALPRFTAFLDQKPKDRERADTVDPPSSKDCLRT
jgi:hypothetical protein